MSRLGVVVIQRLAWLSELDQGLGVGSTEPRHADLVHKTNPQNIHKQ